jgi:LEA14-like dessication related protein
MPNLRFSRRVAAAALAAGAPALLAGCASLGRQVFETPTVSFRDVRVQGVGLRGGQLDVVLDVHNPNGFGLSAQRLTYRVMVDSTAIGTGAITQPFEVGGRRTSEVHLPVTFDFANLGAVGRQLLTRGVVNYRVLGDITVGTPLGNFTRPFDRVAQFNSLGGNGTSR